MNNENPENNDLSEMLNEAYPTPQPPADFAQSLLTDLQSRHRASVPIGQTPRTSFWKKYLPIAAAACVGFAAGIWTIKNVHSPAPDDLMRIAQTSQQNLGEIKDEPGYGKIFKGEPTTTRARDPIPQQTTVGYSPIFNVDHWDVDRLKDAGIAVSAFSHPVLSEFPKLDWVKATFDCSKLTEKQQVILTAWVRNKDQTLATVRTVRDPGAKTVELIFSVDPELRELTSLDIHITKDKPDGGSEMTGYFLHANRILELTKPAPKKLDPQANPQMLAQAGVDRSRLAGVALGLLSDLDTIGRAPLIIRAKVAGWTEDKVQLDIIRVIYGDYAEKTIDFDESGVLNAFKTQTQTKLAAELNRQPTEAEITERTLKDRSMEKGKELIIHLKPFKQKNGSVIYQQMSTHFDAPPAHPLDAYEDKVVNMIAAGDHLSPNFPQPADVLMEYIRDATLIVRAELESVTDAESRWSILGAVKGEPKQKTVVLSHDLFRLRAQAVIRHAQSTTRPAINLQDEIKRMIQNELIVGRTAILFLSDEKTDGDTLKANLNKRIYEDATGKKLDSAANAIQAAMGGKLPMNL